MVVAPVHLHLQVVADFVYQFYLQERFTADEVPNDRLFSEILLMVQYIVNGLFRNLPCHPFLRVLPHQIAVLTRQLAVLSHDERDGLGHTILPAATVFFNSLFHLFLDFSCSTA